MLLAGDIGLGNWGWVIFDGGQPKACGVITTEKTKKKGVRVNDDDAHRAALLSAGLEEIINLYGCKGMVAEMPHGGALSARALKEMSYAAATTAAVAQLLKLPAEWCTPGDVKKAVTGFRSATKEMIADAIVDHFGDLDRDKNVLVQVVRKEKGKELKKPKTRRFVSYDFCGKRWPLGTFEHIADAAGVYIAMRADNMVRMFG